MMKKKFIEHTGIVAPLNISNIDTDVIIPKQFLQRIKRNGFGKYLFYDWRYLDNQGKKLNSKFILNNNIFEKSSILLTRSNFGCGSSREHALWALTDYGFKVIIASSFADIFYNNAINNQLLPIVFDKKTIEKLFNLVLNNPGIKFNINLKKLIVRILNNDNLFFCFKMNNFDYKRILNGVDNISITLNLDKKIKNWEKNNLIY